MPDAPTGRGDAVLDTQLVAPTVLAAPGPSPLGVGAVLARTLRAWWAHALAFSAMSLVAYAPVMAAFGVFTWSVVASLQGGRGAPPSPARLLEQTAILFAGALATTALSVVEMGAVTYGTVRFLNGERARPGQMIAVGLRRGLPVVGTGFVVWIVTVAGTILLVVPGVVFLVAASLAVPAATVERLGVGGALRRSFELTRGSRWTLFAAGLVILVVTWLLSAAVQLGVGALPLVLGPAKAFTVMVLASQLGSALFSVLPAVAIAVCYHDLRRAKEGVDTAELARVFE